jgi:hypothetical protein
MEISHHTTFSQAFVQTNNKWYAFELNSKFDKTLKILLNIKLTIEIKCMPLLFVCTNANR